MALDFPSYDGDLFAPEALREPFGHYREIRDLGPVVYLTRLDAYALARFVEVRDALRAPDTLISGQGVGFSPAFNKPIATTVIMADGDLHRRLRKEIMRPLTPAAVKTLREDLSVMARRRVDELADTGVFDAVEQIARLLPLGAVAHFVGLESSARDRMLEWAAASFNAVGPEAPGHERNFALMAEARSYLLGLDAASVKPGSWAAQLFAAADAGKLSREEACGALNAYVLPSLDTTIFAITHLLHSLALDRSVWKQIQADPSLIPAAVLESVRHTSVVRWFTRFAAQEHAVGDQTIPAGARVALLYASANRDERYWQDPDRFDVHRDARAHLAWGTGPHMCLGMHLARLEMEVILEALVERVAELWCGTPVIGTNRGLYGLDALPFSLTT